MRASSSTRCGCCAGRGACCGWGFSRFTEARYEKPFDATLHQQMVRTASALLEELQGIYAYTESDEISILFRPEWSLFDREVEKLVSISAGVASATFTHVAGVPAVFDSRVWMGAFFTPSRRLTLEGAGPSDPTA